MHTLWCWFINSAARTVNASSFYAETIRVKRVIATLNMLGAFIRTQVDTVRSPPVISRAGRALREDGSRDFDRRPQW